MKIICQLDSRTICEAMKPLGLEVEH